MFKKFLLMLLLVSGQLTAQENESNYAVLNDIAEVLKIFEQCSRMTPSFRTSYSLLDVELVDKIEKMLPAAMQKYAANKKVNLDDYFRQYVSFGMLRRELVYVNAVHKNAARKWAENNPTRQELLKNWQTQSINICGGKDQHWGAIYDGSGGVISEIIFNTSAKK